jgi:CheY-like chemotaxis protein
MPKTIMIVDDEPDNVSTVKEILEREGYTIVTAVDGDDCLKKFPKQKVDLVLMDIMMPGTPVKEVIPKLKGTKVAYLSVVSVSEAERTNLMRSNNVVDYIQKPFDVSDLVRKVKKILG